MQTERECYKCKTTSGLHLHHIYFGTANRRVSDDNGFTVYLCGKHHNLSNYGVHFDCGFDLTLKQECQRKYEETHTRQEFMDLIGRNYIEEDSEFQANAGGGDGEEWLQCDTF